MNIKDLSKLERRAFRHMAVRLEIPPVEEVKISPPPVKPIDWMGISEPPPTLKTVGGGARQAHIKGERLFIVWQTVSSLEEFARLGRVSIAMATKWDAHFASIYGRGLTFRDKEIAKKFIRRLW